VTKEPFPRTKIFLSSVISRKGLGIICLSLLSPTIAHPLRAQEQRWNELNAQVGKLYQQGKYAEAIPLGQESVRVAEATFGPEHPNVATSLSNLAILNWEQGRYADAEPLYRRALAIQEKALGPDHPSVAASLNGIAEVYLEQGRYADAEPLYRRALILGEKALGPDHPFVATSLNGLAEVYEEQGRYADAEPLFKHALAIAEKALGPNHPDVAKSLNNLAGLYWMQGRYADAEPLYKRALAIQEEALGSNHPNVAKSLNNLALLYNDQGRYADAEPLLKRALAIREKALGPDHPSVAQGLNNLAVLYVNQGRYSVSEPLYKRALAILEKALGPNHPDVANMLNNLARLYSVQGRYADAEPLSKRSLAIREKALGPDHSDVAMSLDNLANLYWVQGRYADAEPLYKRALAIREKALGPNHPTVTASLDNLGALFYGWAQPAQASPFFDQAFETLAKRFEYYFTYMSEKERLAFLATVQIRFPGFFSFCFTYRQQLPALAGKMYDTVLWQKGLIAQSVVALRAKILVSGDAQALRLLDELATKKGELAKLASAPAEGGEQKQAMRRAQIEQLKKEANDLEKDLVKRSAALAEERRLAHVTWEQLRDALKPDEAAVEIVRFDFHDGKKWTGTSQYVALIVRPESQEPNFVVLGEAKDLEAAPLRDYKLLVGGEAQRPQAVGSKFYKAFWQPIESALGTARRVYVSTGGALNQVSLGVVPRDDGKLLMEAYDLRVVTSTKDLLRSSHPSANNSAVLVGNPQFLLSPEQQRTAVARLRSQPGTQKAVLPAAGPVPAASLSTDLSRDRAGRGQCDPPPPQGGVLCPLPGTAVEVQSIASLLRAKNWQVAIYEQENALEEATKAVQHPRVLHLSTHGFFLSDQQPKFTQSLFEQPVGLEDSLLRSGLFFAGADRVLAGEPPLADVDNGVLTAYEATTLNLQGTELVVLSACETGLGQTRGGEGVFGLRRALQEAGAESVLMSMWSVPDQETQELMTLFYQKWIGGEEKHEALREAQNELRGRVKTRYGGDLAYYWGAFVLVGQ
jgi:tetratricopeptide (TPR) repeat protein